MKLMVLNLPRDFSEDALAKLFKTQGNIKAVDLVTNDDGTSKGFGFVEMALEHEGVAAIEALHGHQLGKKAIRVKRAD